MLSTSQTEQAVEDGVVLDAKSDCVALVPVIPSAQWSHSPCPQWSLPSSIFVTQLIATAEQEPQARGFEPLNGMVAIDIARWQQRQRRYASRRFSVVVWITLPRRRRVDSVVSPVRASIPFFQNGAVSLSALYPRSRLSDRRGCSAACPSPARSIRPCGPPVLGTRPRRPAVRRVRLERPARSTKEKTHD